VDDVQAKLAEITDMVESAKSMPLSASCVVNRADLLARLGELAELLPAQLSEAQALLKAKGDVIEEGRAEAAQIVADGRTEAARLVSRTEVMQTAVREADRVRTEAEENATRMRVEVEDYVDTKLANFEVVLQKTIAAVERGREKLRGRHELEQLRELSDEDAEAAPLPE